MTQLGEREGELRDLPGSCHLQPEGVTVIGPVGSRNPPLPPLPSPSSGSVVAQILTRLPGRR